MRRSLSTILSLVALLLMSSTLVVAGNAHFVGTPGISTSGSTATASGKVAGLGNIPQIDVQVTAEAACVNRGNKNPSAENKDEFTATGTFPVQNGKALFSLALLASFQPDCSPPMRVEWTLISITVTAADGTFLTYP